MDEKKMKRLPSCAIVGPMLEIDYLNLIINPRPRE